MILFLTCISLVVGTLVLFIHIFDILFCSPIFFFRFSQWLPQHFFDYILFPSFSFDFQSFHFFQFLFFDFFSRLCSWDCMSKIHNDKNKWIYCIEMVSYSTWHIAQSNAWIIRLKWIPAYFMRRAELMLKVPISISYTIFPTATCFPVMIAWFKTFF